MFFNSNDVNGVIKKKVSISMLFDNIQTEASGPC